MSSKFGKSLAMPPGERPCKHCGRGLSDHFLAMSDKRCFMPRDSTRYEPSASARMGESDDLDADDLSALEQLFAALLRGGDTKQILRRAQTASAIRKLHIMHEHAQAARKAGTR